MAARIIAAGSVLAALAQASPVHSNATTTGEGVVYTTEVVTALTTYCPAATTLTHGDKTYTVTEATTLTITDCPCTVSKPVEPTNTPSVGDQCSQDCYKAYNACRIKPNANMSYCAATYAGCLGYSPFNNNGTLETPTACSSQVSSTDSTPTPTDDIVYTTEVVTAITTYCPAPTTLTYNSQTYTVTEPTTLTVTDCPCTISKPHPSASQAPAPDCPAKCADAYNKCRVAPDANMSYCAATYADCLGYSPFGDDGSLIQPTACSKSPAASTSNPGMPQPTTNPGEPAVTTTATAPSGPKTTLPVQDCAGMCYAAYNECRGKPNASRPTCAGEFASCLGYSPFDENGSLVTPTACVSGATGVTVPATGSATAPGTPVATPPATGAAGRIAPGAMLALGAIALL